MGVTDSVPSGTTFMPGCEVTIIYPLIIFCFVPVIFILQASLSWDSWFLQTGVQEEAGGGFFFLSLIPCWGTIFLAVVGSLPSQSFPEGPFSVVLAPTELLTLREMPWGDPESLLSSDAAALSCLREESGAGDPVVFWGGGERWEELLHDVQYDSTLPHRHAPRKCKAPVVTETFFFPNKEEIWVYFSLRKINDLRRNVWWKSTNASTWK